MLVPRLRPYFNYKEIIAALAFWRGGVPDFEKAFAERFGSKYAIAFSYGRTGLYILLKALKLKDAEVICPAYTCVVVPHAIVLSGNIPVFVDCAERDFNMDLDKLEKSITSKTKAIIVTHLFGYPMDCDRVQQIISKWGQKIYLIHDCAHSFGAEWRGKPVWKYADVAFFGLGIGKIISSLYGGMVITDSNDIAKALGVARNAYVKVNKGVGIKSVGRFAYLLSVCVAFHPWVYPLVKWIADNTKLLQRWTKYYQEDVINLPGDAFDPMLNIEARIGMTQLVKYKDIIAERRKIAKRYSLIFNGNNYRYPKWVEGATYSHYPIVEEDKLGYVNECRLKNVELGELIEYLVPEMSAYAQYKREMYPCGKYLSEHIVNYPIWYRINSEHVLRVFSNYNTKKERTKMLL